LRNDERFRINEAAAVNGATTWPYPIADSTRSRFCLQGFDDPDMVMLGMHLLSRRLACRNAEESHADNDVKSRHRAHVSSLSVLKTSNSLWKKYTSNKAVYFFEMRKNDAAD
jgi:hypothetical protein